MDGLELLGQLSRLANEAGPGLEPPGAVDQLQTIVEAVRELLAAAACSVAVVDEDDMTIEFLAAAGEGADRVVGTTLPLSTGIAGWVVASGQSLTVSDAASDSRFAADVASKTGYVPTSLLAVPLHSDDEVIGVLEVLDATVEPDAATSRMLEILAQQATLTLQTVATFDNFGTSVLRVLADATDDSGLSDSLRSVATETRGQPRELAELAALFYTLGRLGPEERSAAVRLLASFVDYAQRVAPQP